MVGVKIECEGVKDMFGTPQIAYLRERLGLLADP